MDEQEELIRKIDELKDKLRKCHEEQPKIFNRIMKIMSNRKKV